MQFTAGFYWSGGALKGDETGTDFGVCQIGYNCLAGTNAPQVLIITSAESSIIKRKFWKHAEEIISHETSNFYC